MAEVKKACLECQKYVKSMLEKLKSYVHVCIPECD
jgi:hypothetical protein